MQEEDLETRLDDEGSPVGLGNLVEYPALEIRVAAVQDPEIARIHADRLPIEFFLLVIPGICALMINRRKCERGSDG